MVNVQRTVSGDRVEVLLKEGGTLEGAVLPSSDEKILVLKLSSGYNAGVLRSNIQHLAVLEKVKKKIVLPSRAKLRTDLPVISILHTGGTIASKIDYETGGVVAQFTPQDLVEKFPELNELCTLRSTLVGNMLSGDMRFAHYNKIAHAIAKEVRAGVRGIIVTHGTDTMGYTAAALSFMLKGLNVPVILVGAQRSSDRGSTDAALNLLSAVRFIRGSDFGEVGICMHENTSDRSCLIFPSCRTKKMHSSRRDAFKSVDVQPYARVTAEGNIEIINHGYRKRDNKKNIKVLPFNEKLRIGWLRARPQLFASEVLAFEHCDGLIVEGTGMGHLPVNTFDEPTKENEKILKVVKKLCAKMPVFMVSQTVFGRVQMQVYSYGRKLLEAGVLGDYNDMLPETAYIKLAWVLSNYKKADIENLMMENFCGELDARSHYVE